MRMCKICSRGFSKPYNLRRHYQRVHPTASPPKLERQARGGFTNIGDTDDVSMQQCGGSVYKSDDTDSEGSEDNEDVDSMNNNVGSDSESDSESDTSIDSDDDEDNSNSVFDPIIEDTEEELGKNATHKDIQKKFRRNLVREIRWCHMLRKNKIYKKIMETVRELRDGPEQYDRDEALSAAVHRRRFLVNRLVPEPDEEDVQSEPGEEDDRDSTQEDDIQV